MRTFFDSWGAFNSCFDKGNFAALTQLVGYKLLAVDNELKHPESFLLTDRELMSRTGIKSGQTIVEARRQLKNAGLIDFKTAKAKPTRYWLIKQNPIKIQASGFISYTSHACDVKTEEGRTPQTPQRGAAAGDEKRLARGSTLDLPFPDDEGDIFKVWANENLRPLGASEKYELLELTENPNYGYKKVKEAIIETKQSRQYPTFKDFKQILTKKKDEEKKGKGTYEKYLDEINKV